MIKAADRLTIKHNIDCRTVFKTNNINTTGLQRENN